jgi:signal transduction histidine kinase/phage shock protein PspC (stress-responsive transcriptional regulator)
MEEPTMPPRPPDGWWPGGQPGNWRHDHEHWHHGGRRRDRHEERAQRVVERLQRWQGQGIREPLRRDPDDRLIGGVAGAIARWRGMNPTTIRVVMVIVVLFSQGSLIPFYFFGWLLVPSSPAPDVPGTSIWSRARHDSRGIALAVAVASVLAFFMVIAGVLNDGLVQDYGWPQVVSAACLVLIWRNAPEEEQASLRRLASPLSSFGPDADRRATRIRLTLAFVLLVLGVGWLLSTHESLAVLQPLGGFILILGAVVLLLGPWWLRIARDLVVERQARVRAEERADIAARVHDSVLQTLALIQRRAEDPQKVVQLARLQERELRSWLFEGRAPDEADEDMTLASGVRQIQQDVESRYGVPVEAVTVGDCELDENLNALLAAAREATVNAAKWSGASVISLFAEVEPAEVSLVVRDRGQGFDPGTVPQDRKGLAESIHGRMARRGGTANVSTAPGEGTKVSLKMPRAVAHPAGRT